MKISLGTVSINCGKLNRNVSKIERFYCVDIDLVNTREGWIGRKVDCKRLSRNCITFEDYPNLLRILLAQRTCRNYFSQLPNVT